MKLDYHRRLGLLAMLGACGTLLLLSRLALLQVIDHDRWAAQAHSQMASWRPIHARRGRILDRNGVELARDEAGFDLTVRTAAWEGVLYECRECGFHRYFRRGQRVGACPRCRKQALFFADSRDVGEVARLLDVTREHLLLRIDRRVAETEYAVLRALDKLSPKLQKARRQTLWADQGWRARRIARDIPYAVAREVELHPKRNPAFRIETVPTRRVPGGGNFVHVVGRVRQESRPVTPPDGTQQNLALGKGIDGLEARFDPELRGEPGWVQVLRDPRRRDHSVVEKHAPVPGLDVRLTIAQGDQEQAILALHGATGAFVVVDATSGAVVALASSPGYEPDEYGRIFARLKERKEETGRWPRHHALRDSACRDFHVPGSILKPFTAAAALTTGVSEPATRVNCEHYFRNRRGEFIRGALRCNGTHGSLALHGALVYSCNIYFQSLVRTMIDKELFPHFQETARGFGLGQPTGIEIEPRPFRDTFDVGKSWSEWVWSSIGQSRILLSPAQIARAYAGLATGALPELRLVAQVGDEPARPRRTQLGLPASVLEPIRAALREVPRTGTAKGHGLDRLALACKTGTAQRVGLRRRYNAWLAGFAPARRGRPAIAFAMVILETDRGGADACGPRVGEFFRYFYGRVE